MEPIFIIGTERSGTNLLRLILNSHSNIAIPHPPHIMKNLFGLQAFYSDLSKDANFRRLINDVARLVELHPYPWGIKIDREIIFKSVKERNLINVCFSVYGQYLESTGKKVWGSKSTFMIYHVGLIRRYYPEAKFIYMVRDGRDVAASARKTIFNRYSAYYVAGLWKKEQDIGIYWLNKLSAKEIFLLKYEDLLQDPEAKIRSVCSFLNEPFENGMLRFFDTEEAKKSQSLSRAWENTAKPILKDNSRKFKNELSAKDIDLFEAIAGAELDYFSYSLSRPFYVSESARARGVKFKLSYLLEEKILAFTTQVKYFFSDKNSIQRYRKYWFLKFIRILRWLERPLAL